jgi:hypothetical protein
LEELGKPADARAESLAPEEFEALARTLGESPVHTTGRSPSEGEDS